MEIFLVKKNFCRETVNMNKLRISKINNIISGWSETISPTLVSPTTSERTSLFFPQGGQLSARSLLHSQDNQSAANSSRLPSQLEIQDLEQNNKLANASLNLGALARFDEERGIIVQRNRSSEVLLTLRDNIFFMKPKVF